MTRPVKGGHPVYLPDDAWESIDARADSMDLPTNTAVWALIEGSLRLGQVERLVHAGLEGKAVRRRNRGTVSFWTAVQPDEERMTTGIIASNVWVHGSYVLARVGEPKGGHEVEPPENGWWVAGPGLSRTHVGYKAADARRDAEAIVRRVETQATANGNGETASGGR